MKDAVIPFGLDTTLRWSCRAGDYVLWMRFQGIFSSPGKHYEVADFWELRDGDSVTITNRHVDLPVWFDLHPLEVSGLSMGWMKKRLDEGYNPQEPIDGPNLWRVFTGDRIVWVGPKRRGMPATEDGVLGLIAFKKNALVYGEPCDPSVFGQPSAAEPSPEGVKLGRAGWEAVNRLGLPREAAADSKWCIG